MQKPKRRKRGGQHRRTPDSPAKRLDNALRAHREGRFSVAKELYHQVLETSPRHVDALHYLGVLMHSMGKADESIRLIQRALFLDPNYIAARINCGNVLKESKRYAEAEQQFRKALALDPRNGDASNNLGVVLKAQHRIEPAIRAFEQATKHSPENADAYQNLGNALKKAGRVEEALTAFRRAVELDPHQSDAHLNLGRALYRFGRVDEASIVYEKWLQIDPDNSIASHMLAACRGEGVPDRCSDDFVRRSFDAFADSFDEVLGRLDYRAPELVARAVDVALPEPSARWHVLDAGCGTGLCGARLRPHAAELIGIDLSAKMLAQASKPGTYDLLEEVELTQYMLANAGEFDLIIATDTFVYFGDLTDVFLAAYGALNGDGVFVFTVEENHEGQTYRLQPHGRYCHSRSLIEESLVRSGFRLQSLEHEVLRMEAEQPVDGLVVTARRDD
ncbi:MAG: tetratricopeptide repeat protein [Planctomycetota bacterium]